ncbi:MAG: hypothetical protein ACKO5E_22865 [bacterium]
MSIGDDFDPYAPPKADTSPKRQSSGFGESANFTVGDVLNRSWQILRSQLGLTIGATILYFVLGNLLAFFSGVVDDQSLKLILSLANTIATIFFQIGFFTFMLNLASGRDAKLADLFSGGPLIIPIFLASLLFGLVIMGALIPAFLIGAILGPIGILVALIYGLIAYVMIFTRLIQYYFLLIDREVGIVESLTLSSKLMKGKEIQFMSMSLMLLLINLCGLFALGLGLIITVPLSFVCLAVYYLGITGQPVADPFAMN